MRSLRLERGSVASTVVLLAAVLGVAVAAAAAVTVVVGRLRRERVFPVTSEHRSDEVLARVSHELRTPLTSVIGFAHTLRDETIDMTETERNEILGYVIDEAEATLTVVEDLLAATDLSRRGAVHVSSEVLTDVAATVRDVIERSAQLRGGAITVTGTAGVTCDEGRFRQIMRNLLANAVEHGAEPITVSISCDGATARIAITDSGTGVPADVVDVMFDRDLSVPRRGGAARSSGIGLWLSRELAQRMGGDLRYLGVADGTVFELVLPAGRAA
jgi:signal transduction histidine kinase